jgi:hypothetical protein
MNWPPPKMAESQKKKGEKSASPDRKRKMKAMAIDQWATLSWWSCRTMFPSGRM